MSSFVRKTLSSGEAKLLQLIVEAINQDLQAHGEMICQGKCKDYAEYRDKTGYLRGLSQSLQRIEEVRKKYEDA